MPQDSDLLRAFNDIIDALVAFWRAIRKYRRRPAVAGTLRLGGSAVTTADVTKIKDNEPAPLEFSFVDAEGAPTTELPGALQLTVDRQDLVDITPPGADLQGGSVQAKQGWAQAPAPHVFVLTANAGLPQPLTSGPVEIDPTVATSGVITLGPQA